MEIIYDVLHYVGYFIILIIFSIIAIIFAKKLHSWIWYSIGATITFFSLFGNQKSYESYYGSYYTGEIMAPYWIIYVIVLFLVAGIIIYRYSKAKDSIGNVSQPSVSNENNEDDYLKTGKIIYEESVTHKWRCNNCNNMISSYPCEYCQANDPNEKDNT